VAARKKLVLAGDYWCPYNCAPNSDSQGFLVDVIKRSLYIYGIDVEYKMMPWHEALHKVEKGEVDGIIGISNVKGMNIVVTDMPLEYSATASFTRCDTDWTYDGIPSLRGKKLGLIMDYSLDEDVSNFVGTNYPTSPSRFVLEDGPNAVVDSITNLIDQNIDVYIEDKRVVEHYVNEHALSSSIKLPLYVAFNDQIPGVKDYIKYLNEGIASLKSTGEYQHLREKYKLDAGDSSIRTGK
jgi:polar amino acid transport system substrate-binding protein